jgi:hypothetical protein
MSIDVCPNTTSKEWLALEAAYGEDGAYRKWLENGKEIPGVSNFAMGNAKNLIEDLQRNVEMGVVVNPNLENTAKLINKEDEKRIEINPNLLNTEVGIHEFGHVALDLLGGMNNPIIKAGASRLKGSDLEKTLREKYPVNESFTEEMFQKELISSAFTKSSYDTWKTNTEKANAISRWKTAYFKLLKKETGINEEVAKKLASKSFQDDEKNKIEEDIEYRLYGIRPSPAAAPASAKQKKLAKEALGIITSKIELLRRKIDDSNKGQQSALASLIELQKKLSTYRADLAIAEFILLARHQTDIILEKFEEYEKDPEKATLHTIQYLNNSMLSFDPQLLRDISQDLTPEQSEVKKELDKILIAQMGIQEKFKRLSVSLVKKEFGTGVFTKVKAVFARKAEIEFNKNNREEESSEKKEKRKEYIEKYLEDNAEKIEERKEEKLDSFLTTIEKDISTIDAFINNPKDMNSDIIREVAKLFDKADFEIQQESVFMARKAEMLNKKYEQYFGKFSDQKKKWEPILAVDEDGEIAPGLVIKGSSKWKQIKSTGGKYKGTPVEEMYDFLLELSEETDGKLPPRGRLDGRLPVLNKNTFERIAENGIFTAIKEGTLDIFKLRKEDTDSGQIEDESTEKKEEDIRSSMDDTVKVLSTQAGEEKKVIPINFRGKIKETEQSYDVLSLMVLDSHQAINYENKSKLASTVEVVLSLVSEAKVLQRSGFMGRLKEQGDGRPQFKVGGSNTYDALERLIENRLYGIQTTGDPKLAKMSQKIKQYVSIINLFGNYLSAGANFTQGLAMVFMEGAGAQFYNTKNVMRAERKYWKSIPSNISDASRHRAKGKTNLLRELFNAQSEWTVLEHQFSKDNGLKRNANLGTGLMANSAAEHSVQSIGMYAVLDNIKVKNKDGKYITKEGTVTENRSEAMSLDEAYEVGYQNTKTKKTISREAYEKLSKSQKEDYMDGVLHLNEKVVSTDRTQDEGTFEISQVLRRVNRDLFGNYDAKNKSALEAHAIGSLFGHMRQWMVPGFKKRYKGLQTLWIKDKDRKLGFRTLRNEELRDVDLDFNVETEEFEEGMYVSTVRWLGVMMRDIKALKFKILSESWKDLTEMEKRNIMRTASELAMMAAAYSSYVLLAGAMDDDNDDNLPAALATFYSRRLLAELMTYSNPVEWVRTFRSPAVSLSLLENAIKAISQTITDPTEVYDRGINKGKNKMIRKWLKLTPAKILDKDVEESLKWLKRGY